MATESSDIQTTLPQPGNPLTADDAQQINQPPIPEEPSPSAESIDTVELGEKRKRSEESDQTLKPLWKTTLCSYFRRSNGECSHGETCRYAHGEEELRPRPDNTWDPTSEQAKKLLKSDDGEKVRSNEIKGDILMTESLDDGVDGEDSSDPVLSKCLVNLPMKWHADNLRNFLTEQGIAYKSAKKKKGMFVGFVNFDSAEQVKRAVEELDGRTVGNKTLKVADLVPRSFENKKPLSVSTKESSVGDNEELAASKGNEEHGAIADGSTPSCGKARTAREAVTPLAHMPYVDQLEQKQNTLKQTLKKLTKNTRKACPHGVSLPQWVLQAREIGGLPCIFEGIIESPLVNGYRNKCEFSVGCSVQGKPTVGFMLGNFREGVTAVEEPTDCPNVSRISCKYAAIFQDFLQNSSLPVWNRLNNAGFWRQLTVREGRKSRQVAEVDFSEADIAEVMLIVQVCTDGVDDGLVNKEFEKMAQAFAAGASADFPLPRTALVVQDHKGISNVAPADAPLRSISISSPGNLSIDEAVNNGAEVRIHDYISNLKFSISPMAFFQVNTLAAEKLYSLAGDWAGLSHDTLLFDICCGTGTIGLTLAHRVGKVVGIEMNASAVANAVKNAEINGIENCRFVCGKAEDVLGSLLKEYGNINSDETAVSSERKVEDSTDIEKSSSECPEIISEGLDTQAQTGSVSEDCAPKQQLKNIVAIVDPPRVGLHPTVIKALRTHPLIRRLVYISCNPESLVANAIELCTPSAIDKGNKSNRGWRNMSSAGLARHRVKSMPESEPFRPVKSMAVDLFPHTPHCELVMLLER